MLLLLLRDDCDDDDVWRSNDDDDVSVVLYLFARALRRASLAFIVSISITSLSVVDCNEENMVGVGGCILILAVDDDDDDDGGDDVNALIL